jgi:hypothetical protein
LENYYVVRLRGEQTLLKVQATEVVHANGHYIFRQGNVAVAWFEEIVVAWVGKGGTVTEHED